MMESRAKAAGHPIHQQLVVFPLGLLAAVFGAIDYLAIPAETRAERVGAAHGVGNVVVVALFAISWLLRMDSPGHVATSTTT